MHDNPYPEGTNRHEAWEDGWVLACEEARGKKPLPVIKIIIGAMILATVLHMLGVL